MTAKRMIHASPTEATPAHMQRPSRMAALLEVGLVFTLAPVLGHWLFRGLSGWPLRYAAGVMQIVVPLLILSVARRDFAAYGLSGKRWRYNLDVGLRGYVVRLIPWGVGFGLIAALGSSYTRPAGALILAVTSLIATWALFAHLRYREQRERVGGKRPASTRSNLLIVAGLLALPIGLGLVLNRLSLAVVATVIWQFVCSGFGEEIRFRGYYQSRLNQAFGRPFRVLDVPFGPGLIITSGLFALVHVLNTADLFGGRYEFAWWWGLWAFFGGVFFGLIREKTGSIVAAGIAHGLPDAVGESLALLFGWRL